MTKKEISSIVEELSAKYPRRGSAMLPALDAIQRRGDNCLLEKHIKDVAQVLHATESSAFGVASYYTMFNTAPVGRYHIQVDTNIPAMLMGANEVVAALESTLGIGVGDRTEDGMFSLAIVEDLGSSGTCPVVQVNDTYYECMSPREVESLIESLKRGEMPARQVHYNYGTQCGILLKNRGESNSTSIQTYKGRGGYVALKRARQMAPEDVLAEVKEANLRGRGGAGFPAGLKWSFLPERGQEPVYLICNGDEGEPGTFKDRQIMEYDPHLLIEGMAIAAYAIGANRAFIYIRGEFRWIADILQGAIQEARMDGQLLDLDIVVHRGAGSYVCGEETALIESLEGKRGNPRLKPPFPANAGLYGYPTIVNNVETLACVPFIIEKGAEEFKKIGTENNFGPKLFAVSGHVNRPGVYEYPLGTDLSEVLSAAGGVKGKLKAVIVGGLSAPVLKAEETGALKLDFDSCLKAGTMLGSGGIIVMNDTVSIPEISLRAMRFYAHESCGQCVPCREGSYAIVQLLQRVGQRRGTTADVDAVLHICKNMKGLTLCPMGESFAMSLEPMIRKFRDEFEALTI